MGTVGREGKRVGAIELFEYLKTCQLAMLEMVRPPVRAIEIHDAIADQDRLCLALSRAQAVKVGCMYCQVTAGWLHRRARRSRPAVPHCGCARRRSNNRRSCAPI